MRIKFTSAILLVALMFSCKSATTHQEADTTATAYYEVIPAPQMISKPSINANKPFVLTANTKITYPKGDVDLERYAGFLKEYIQKQSSIALNIVPDEGKPSNNIVLLQNYNNENKEGYQIERSKMAIAKGGILGQGAGKSTMKNFLPQSSSDFIYAIITEEYGLVGAFSIMLLYIVLLMRIVVISQKAPTLYGQLLVLGVGLPIILQALINMGVAVELLPVTGQNLPLISSGGTSIWMTCLALGCILSVSAHKRKEEGKMETDKPEADVEEELAEDIIKITKK